MLLLSGSRRNEFFLTIISNECQRSREKFLRDWDVDCIEMHSCIKYEIFASNIYCQLEIYMYFRIHTDCHANFYLFFFSNSQDSCCVNFVSYRLCWQFNSAKTQKMKTKWDRPTQQILTFWCICERKIQLLWIHFIWFIYGIYQKTDVQFEFAFMCSFYILFDCSNSWKERSEKTRCHDWII